MPCLTWKKKHQPTIVLHCTTVKLYHEEKRCSCEGCVECSKNFFHRLIYRSFFALFFETNVAGNTTLDVMGNRDTVVALVIKSVKNPRSALCKTALMTSTDMFMAYQDQLLDLLDPLLLQLLLKASQDKRFVCEEAERTLRGMTTSISPQPMLQKLQPYVNHRNPRVRAKAAMCMYNSVSRLVCPFGMLAHILCCQSKMSNPTGLFHGLSTFQQVF
jgi:hypothetical protein